MTLTSMSTFPDDPFLRTQTSFYDTDTSLSPQEASTHFDHTDDSDTFLYAQFSTTSSNLSQLPPLEHGLPPNSQLVLIPVYTLTTLLSVVGNFLVIVVFLTGRRSRTDLRVYLINLAVADLVMAVFCMPFTFTMTMLGNWVFSEPMCPIVLYMQIVSVTASVGTNMAIGVDRYMVVIHPLRSRITKARSKFVLGAVWLVAFSLSSVQLAVGRSRTFELSPGEYISDCNEIWPEPSGVWRRAYTFFIFVLTYLLPLTILVCTYSFLGRKLWRHSAPGNTDRSRDIQQFKSKCKVIRMLLVVVVLFAVCWLPLHTFTFVLDFNPHLMDYETEDERILLIAIYYVVHWLAMSNSFVNPIIYSFLNNNFKKDLRSLLGRCCPRCPRCRLRSSRGDSSSPDKNQTSPPVGLRYVSSERRRSSTPQSSLLRRSTAAVCQTALGPCQPLYCTSYLPVRGGPGGAEAGVRKDNSYARLSVGRNTSSRRYARVGRQRQAGSDDAIGAGVGRQRQGGWDDGIGTKLTVKPPLQSRHHGLAESDSSRRLMASDSSEPVNNYSRLSASIESELVPI